MQIQARYYEAYEMCDVVDRLLRDPFEHATWLEGFTCDGGWVGLTEPFEKYSALHKLVEYVARNIHHEQAEAFDLAEHQRTIATFEDTPAVLDDLQLTTLPIELAFNTYEITHETFLEHLTSIGKTFLSASEADIYHFMQDTFLTEEYSRLLDHTVREVFHIVFQNRNLLLHFNEYLSGVVSKAQLDQVEGLPKDRFDTNGTLRRYRPPQWAQRAVFFRDRGRCILCDKDLSGLTNLANIENYDHIVPLARFGLNDVSNLQLLCAECNKGTKAAGAGVTSHVYQTWYSYDD